MKAFPLWIKPVGRSNQRSHLWPLKQLSCVEEGRSNPAHGEFQATSRGGNSSGFMPSGGTAPSQLEAESSPVSQLDALPCLGKRVPLAAASPFYACATLCREIIPAACCNAPSRGVQRLPGCRQPQAVVPVHSPSALSTAVAPAPWYPSTSPFLTCLFSQ